MDENQVDEISIVGHDNINEKERNKMVFDLIADLEREKQGRSMDKIMDCCTKLGIDRSQVEKDGSVFIHNINLQVLVTEMFKINRGISFSIMKGVSEPEAEHPYNLRCFSQFSTPLVSTVFHGTENISFFGSKIWGLLPENFKNIDSLDNFKMGFLCNKRLCIISQDNI